MSYSIGDEALATWLAASFATWPSSETIGTQHFGEHFSGSDIESLQAAYTVYIYILFDNLTKLPCTYFSHEPP